MNNFTNSRSVNRSDKLVKPAINARNFNTITEENEAVNSRKQNDITYSNYKNSSMEESSTPINIQAYQLFARGKTKRTFSEFYKEQMDHVKNKIDHIQNGIQMRDKIFEDMKRQRDQVTHLSERSKRILTHSRERNRSGQTRNVLNTSAGGLKNTLHSPNSASVDFKHKTVHDRLFQERYIFEKNRTLLQHSEDLKIKSMLKYGSKNRISRERTALEKAKLSSSRSAININLKFANLRELAKNIASQDSKLKNTDTSRSNLHIDPEATVISNKLYEDAKKRKENQIKQEKEHSQSPKHSQVKAVTSNSIKYLINRFNEDFSTAIK